MEKEALFLIKMFFMGLFVIILFILLQMLEESLDGREPVA